jgi:acyl dehydratase
VVGVDFDAKLQALVAEQAEAGPARARDPVNQPMIRHWCDAMDDQNPVYTDPEFAAKSIHGGIVAPPTMLQAWTMRGLRPPAAHESEAPRPPDSIFGLLDSAGFTSVVATNCVQEYKRYVRPGDDLSVEIRTESVSPEKKTALGIGHFVTQRQTFRDADGEEVASMLFRMLKFKPGTGAGAA